MFVKNLSLALLFLWPEASKSFNLLQLQRNLIQKNSLSVRTAPFSWGSSKLQHSTSSSRLQAAVAASSDRRFNTSKFQDQLRRIQIPQSVKFKLMTRTPSHIIPPWMRTVLQPSLLLWSSRIYLINSFHLLISISSCLITFRSFEHYRCCNKLFCCYFIISYMWRTWARLQSHCLLRSIQPTSEILDWIL